MSEAFYTRLPIFPVVPPSSLAIAASISSLYIPVRLERIFAYAHIAFRDRSTTVTPFRVKAFVAS